MRDSGLRPHSARVSKAAGEAIRRCRTLADCTEEAGHITRTFLSTPMHQVHALVRGWMEAAGMRVWVDAAGNIRGVLGDGPRLLIGSHLDTVPHAGAFDGMLGVMIGIALVELRAASSRGVTPFAIEVVGFSEEEGVRFGVPFIGSSALAGDPVMDEGVLDAICAFGLDPAQLAAAAIGDEVKAYLEFHIEQGPVLEAMNRAVAVVDAIVGQSRYDVTFQGKANHAGTTPMNRRSDALCAAAEWIGHVEREGLNTPELVATVGRVEVEPGATNVIPGAVRASLDVRSPDDATRLASVARLCNAAESIAGRRGVVATHRMRLDQAAVSMNAQMVQALSAAIESAGFTPHHMVSGAGHDAMILASKIPSAMLFLRSPGGISHHPGEAVLVEDVEAALAVGLHFLDLMGDGIGDIRDSAKSGTGGSRADQGVHPPKLARGHV